MTGLDLAAIRQRADQPVLGKSIARALDQAILDRAALLDALAEKDKALKLIRDTLRDLRTETVTERDQYAARLAAVRELHKPRPNSASALYPEPLCTCGKEYPCATAQAVAK